MNAPPNFLAFDLGATSWRAVLGRRAGAGFVLEEVHRERHAPREVGGALHWDLDGIFLGVKRLLRRLALDGVQIAAIGIDSWSVDYGLLDAAGALVEPPRCYRDPRNQGMAAALASRVGRRELFERTGLMQEDITTLCQLIAASRDTPELLRRARRLLFVPDLIRYWLCGEQATDLTLATTSQMFDIRRGCWDADLLAAAGIDGRMLPEVRRGHSVLGSLSGAVQAETGLGAVPVTTGASHDTAAAFLTQPEGGDAAVLISGTWSILGVHLPRPLFSPSIDPERFGYEGNPDGTFRLLCNIPGMWILERCLDAWHRQGISLSYDELVRGAESEAAFPSRIDPYDPVFLAPDDMVCAVREYCARTGQPEPVTPHQTARALFHGLAATTGGCFRELTSLSSRAIRRLVVVGGGARNGLLNRLIEERSGVEVSAGEPEATALGNIMGQELALASASA